MSTDVSFIKINEYEITLSRFTDDQISDIYSYVIFEDRNLKVIPHLLQHNVAVLRALFAEIFDNCILKNDNDRVVVQYSDLRHKGYFVASLLGKVQVSGKDDTILSVNDTNVVKIEKIASGIKTVIEFKPATHKH